MSYDTMAACADMTIADAIEDMAMEESITLEKARNNVLSSKAYQSIYDFDTGMWKEGPDYFRDTFRRTEKRIQ